MTKSERRTWNLGLWGSNCRLPKAFNRKGRKGNAAKDAKKSRPQALLRVLCGISFANFAVKSFWSSGLTSQVWRLTT
jgi:hypothetical protein